MPLFGTSKRAPTQEKVADAPARRGSILTRGSGGSDHLRSARAKLDAAVQSERDSEAALQRAKVAVKEARAEVALLEKEAIAESKQADRKLREAKSLRRAADKLHH